MIASPIAMTGAHPAPCLTRDDWQRILSLLDMMQHNPAWTGTRARARAMADGVTG